jgi:hypothetical protein
VAGDPGITWWNAYVVMKYDDVRALCNPIDSRYDPVFAANLAWCSNNHAYGFGEYDPAVHPSAGDNRAHWWGCPGGILNGPTKS